MGPEMYGVALRVWTGIALIFLVADVWDGKRGAWKQTAFTWMIGLAFIVFAYAFWGKP